MLALELRQEAKRLRFYDPGTPNCLLSSAEEQQGRLRAEQRWQLAEEDRQLEAAARRQAEARLHDEAAARRQAEAARRQAEARPPAARRTRASPHLRLCSASGVRTTRQADSLRR